MAGNVTILFNVLTDGALHELKGKWNDCGVHLNYDRTERKLFITVYHSCLRPSLAQQLTDTEVTEP